mmetsp:Transcript_7403/g.18682  ORF Transcript_7403/g.18682 Transcript_7403/m.18682 type:complete len:264 (+) Transcript_7403:403-1194(+)
MQPMAASRIATAGTGRSLGMARPPTGPPAVEPGESGELGRLPLCPSVKELVNIDISSLNPLLSATSNADAMISGDASSNAAVRRTASSWASFSVSFLPTMLLLASVGLVLAVAQARRSLAPCSGGKSKAAMPNWRQSSWKSRKREALQFMLCLRKFAKKIVSITTAKPSVGTTVGVFMLSISEACTALVGSQEATKSKNGRQEVPRDRCNWSTMSSNMLSRFKNEPMCCETFVSKMLSHSASPYCCNTTCCIPKIMFLSEQTR